MYAEHVLTEPKADRSMEGHIEVYAPNDEVTDEAALAHDESYVAAYAAGMLPNDVRALASAVVHAEAALDIPDGDEDGRQSPPS